MKLTPDRQAQFPNSVQDCWSVLDSGIRCLVGFDGKGNGLCPTHNREVDRVLSDDSSK